MTTALILRIHDPEKELIIETDASNKAIGGCLKQRDDQGKLHLVAYFSRKLTPLEANYNVYNKELLAIVVYLEI